MEDYSNPTLTNEEKKAILMTLTELIAIPSVKSIETPDAPYGIHTLHALEYMLELGRQHGFSVKNLDGRAGYIEWGSGDKLLGILCHLDVVPAGEGWNHDPFTLRHENGWLTGRGINDDKGPAVTVFYAMLRLKTQGYIPPCRIRLILGLDEECGSSCMEHYKLVEELPTLGFTPDADFPAIFAEKGILQLRVSGPVSKGLLVSAGERPNMVPARCEITIITTQDKIEGFGIPAHASKPQLGKNAIYEALKALPESILAAEPLPAFFMKFIGKDTSGQFLFTGIPEDISGALTLNAGILQMNAGRSELIIDIRYPVTSDAGKIISEISVKSSGFGLQVDIVSHQQPLYRDPGEPLIQTLLDVYEKYVGLAPYDPASDAILRGKALKKPSVPIAIGGGTYARTMPGVVAFGPAFPWEKDQAHQIDEAECEDSIYLLVQLYQDAISSLCKNLRKQSDE